MANSAHFDNDILALSVDTETLEWLLAELKKGFDDVKADIGNDLSYLGMHIQLTNGKATVSMTQFLKEPLDDYGHVREYNTPAADNLDDDHEVEISYRFCKITIPRWNIFAPERDTLRRKIKRN